MVRVQGPLWLATMAGHAGGLHDGMQTLALVIYATVAALVFLVAYMAITRQGMPWQMRREASSLYDAVMATGGRVVDAVRRLHARAREEGWPWPKHPFSFIRNAKYSLDSRGSVLPIKHGRKSKLPAEIALEIINLVHAGYDTVEVYGGHPFLVRNYYQSFTQACEPIW
jgi:hypothetical protein